MNFEDPHTKPLDKHFDDALCGNLDKEIKLAAAGDRAKELEDQKYSNEILSDVEKDIDIEIVDVADNLGDLDGDFTQTQFETPGAFLDHETQEVFVDTQEDEVSVEIGGSPEQVFVEAPPEKNVTVRTDEVTVHVEEAPTQGAPMDIMPEELMLGIIDELGPPEEVVETPVEEEGEEEEEEAEILASLDREAEKRIRTAQTTTLKDVLQKFPEGEMRNYGDVDYLESGGYQWKRVGDHFEVYSLSTPHGDYQGWLLKDGSLGLGDFFMGATTNTPLSGLELTDLTTKILEQSQEGERLLREIENEEFSAELVYDILREALWLGGEYPLDWMKEWVIEDSPGKSKEEVTEDVRGYLEGLDFIDIGESSYSQKNGSEAKKTKVDKDLQGTQDITYNLADLDEPKQWDETIANRKKLSEVDEYDYNRIRKLVEDDEELSEEDLVGVSEEGIEELLEEELLPQFEEEFGDVELAAPANPALERGVSDLIVTTPRVTQENIDQYYTDRGPSLFTDPSGIDWLEEELAKEGDPETWVEQEVNLHKKPEKDVKHRYNQKA